MTLPGHCGPGAWYPEWLSVGDLHQLWEPGGLWLPRADHYEPALLQALVDPVEDQLHHHRRWEVGGQPELAPVLCEGVQIIGIIVHQGGEVELDLVGFGGGHEIDLRLAQQHEDPFGNSSIQLPVRHDLVPADEVCVQVLGGPDADQDHLGVLLVKACISMICMLSQESLMEPL